MNSEPSKLGILQIYRKLIYWLFIRFRTVKSRLCLSRIYVFRRYLKCFQKVDEIIQLARLNRFWKVKKNNKIYQEQSRERAREIKTQWFILVHPSSRATSSPLLHSKDFHYKKIKPDQFTKNQQLATRKNTLLPVENNPMKPTTDQKLFKNHCII